MNDFLNFSGFRDHQYAWLLLGFTLFLCSLYFHIRSKSNPALFFLLASALSFYIFAALLDPFINAWDERYHALAAKNCMDNFLEPRLYMQKLIPEHDYTNWTTAHIWLHKPPLFLWQIALSFKLFGISEFTLRLPSIIMGTGLVFFGYRIATLLKDSKLGYYTALSVTFSWFLIHLISGWETLEHNDVCFIFYVTASVWSLMEYFKRNRAMKWLFLIGFFSGCAIMTKWLPGLLVFFIWGLYLLLEYKFKVKSWKIHHILISLSVTAATVLPWQIYIFKNHRDIALSEFRYNMLHLSEPIENHASDFFYHLRATTYLFIGDDKWQPNTETGITQIVIYTLLITGLLLLLWYLKKNSLRLTILGTFLGVYLFYSIAQTKMPAYTFPIGVIGFMSLGALLYGLDNFLSYYIHNTKIKWLILIPVIILFSFRQMNFSLIRSLHTKNDNVWWREDLIHNKNVCKKLDKILPENCIIFNVRGDEHNNFNALVVDAMFYSNRDCYTLPPSKESIEIIKNHNYSIAIFTHHPIPDYIWEDSTIIKIDEIIKNDI